MSEIRSSSPTAPPLLCLNARRKSSGQKNGGHKGGDSMVSESTLHLWDKLFEEGYRADVLVHTTTGVITAHASILGMASPVMKKMLKQSKNRGRSKSISIRGVPHDAVRVFLRLLYSSRYKEEEMKQYAMHLLVLFHAFGIPSLKNLCIQKLEKGLLTLDNVVDVFQLAQLCDAPRLRLLCHRMIVANFPAVSTTEGWQAMKQSNPCIETELLESVAQADSRKKERMKKMEERKIYLQLHEAMEALVHICRDGCRTIGPHDKQLNQSAAPCNFPACRGLESLFRHFAACKKRVSGGCAHCKRMWQLFELHSRICGESSNGCKVPLCGHFKEKAAHEHSKKKDVVRWKLLVSKVLEARTLCS